MKATWDYSLKTEALRLIHTAHQIVVGFYRINNFIVLPYDSANCDAGIVTFPDLPYNQIHGFWEKVKTVNVKTLPISAGADLVENIKTFIDDQHLTKPHYEETRRMWDEAQDEIISEIRRVIPSANKIKSLTVFPTAFGTNTSFNWIDNDGQILLYLRHDSDIYALTEAILASLTRKDVYEQLDGVWAESELLVDWLVKLSSISKVLAKHQKVSNYIPTLKTIRVKNRAQMIADSKNFYQKLGVPFNIPKIEIDSLVNLTPREKDMLALMIRKGGSLTTVDE